MNSQENCKFVVNVLCELGTRRGQNPSLNAFYSPNSVPPKDGGGDGRAKDGDLETSTVGDGLYGEGTVRELVRSFR